MCTAHLLNVSRSIPCVCVGGASKGVGSASRGGVGQSPQGHMTCDACWEATPPCGQTNITCENITLPQTLFAAGKYIHFQIKPAFDILLELFFEEQDA